MWTTRHCFESLRSKRSKCLTCLPFGSITMSSQRSKSSLWRRWVHLRFLFFWFETKNFVRLIILFFYVKLKRAIVRSPVTGQYETADYRISKRLVLVFRDSFFHNFLKIRSRDIYTRKNYKIPLKSKKKHFARTLIW